MGENMTRNVRRTSAVFAVLAVITVLATVSGCSSNGAGGGTGGSSAPETYNLGDTGPAGGIVFYDKGEFTDGWRYLEAWTADEDEPYQWKTDQTWTTGTSEGIGTGYVNTYSAMTGTEHPAAEVVRDATHGGYTDWFLPSKDELDLMYDNLKAEDMGDFETVWYWSSSEVSANISAYQSFGNGNQRNIDKTRVHNVRAVRAF